jgi:hypothetical protein
MKRDEEPPTEDKGKDRVTNEQSRLIEDYVREIGSYESPAVRRPWSPHAAPSMSHPVRPLPGARPSAAASARRLADCAGRFHPARRASRISSMLTGAISPSGARKAGLDALADASDAHEARIARFSERLSAGSATTSRGWLNTVPG